MMQETQRERPLPGAPPRSFRLAFTVMYIGIISAIIYFNVVSRCGNPVLLGDTGALAVILLIFLGIERFEHWRPRHTVSRSTALALILARMALIEAVATLDCSGFSWFLYPVVPFTAYFTLGSRFANYLSLFYFGLYLGKLWLADAAWYSDINDLSNFMVFILLLIFLQVMARAIRRDEENQQRLERLLGDLEATNRQLHAYAEQVAELAAAEERNRLARDIHDSLGHYLTAVTIQLEKALAFRERDPVASEQAIWDAKQSASEALQDVRRSVSTLRDAQAGFSLRRALTELVRGMDNGRLAIDLQVEGEEAGYSRPALMALYRAAQEGLTNVQKHAQASRVTMTVTLGPEKAHLRLADDGSGFDTVVLEDLAHAPHHSFGLQGIQERVELVRGEMTLTSKPGRGTELMVTVPQTLVD